MDDASRIQDLGRALAKAIDQAWLQTRDRTFPEMVNAYRQVEADFVQKPGSNDYHVLETKRRIAEMILQQANSTEQSFQICQDIWNDLLRLGFSDIGRRSTMTWFYADCCLINEQNEIGLALVEPLIAEFETALADPTCTEQAKRFYNQELEPLRKIRDELESPTALTEDG